MVFLEVLVLGEFILAAETEAAHLPAALRPKGKAASAAAYSSLCSHWHMAEASVQPAFCRASWLLKAKGPV